MRSCIFVLLCFFVHLVRADENIPFAVDHGLQEIQDDEIIPVPHELINAVKKKLKKKKKIIKKTRKKYKK